MAPVRRPPRAARTLSSDEHTSGKRVNMTVEHLVGLNVIDEPGYARYRQEMTPLLHAVGGDFRYDFRIAEVLKTEASHPINRVFVICFPDRDSSERFFADARYLAVRHQFFEPAIQGWTRLGDLER